MFQHIMDKQCKQCGKPMKLRKGNYGEFWGCTGYPSCKQTEQLESSQTQENTPRNDYKPKSVSEGVDPLKLLADEIVGLREEVREMIKLMRDNLGE